MADLRLDELAHTRVRIQLSVSDAAAEGGSWTREIPSTGFETTERGVVLGTLTIPWHRVIEYRQIVLDDSMRELNTEASRMQMRVRLDDGTPDGATHMVAADAFAAEPWTVALLLSRRVDATAGMTAIEKLFVPWHRVLEYERIMVESEMTVPDRPDAEQPATHAVSQD